MTLGDPVLALVIGAFSILGAYRGGLMAGIGWGAIVAGLLAGSLIGMPIDSMGSTETHLSTWIAVALAMFTTTLVAMNLKRIQARLRTWAPAYYLSLTDRLMGALLGTLGGACVAWVVVIVVASAPGAFDLKLQMSRSAIASGLLEAGPSRSTSVKALAQTGLFPALEGPLVTVDTPRENVAATDMLRTAVKSVVRITGKSRCEAATGSGWVYAPNVVVTNAHVVAGHVTDQTMVESEGYTRPHPARVVHFDADNDVAILRTANLQLDPLKRAKAVQGQELVALAYTLAKRVATPARMDSYTEWPTLNIYDRQGPDRAIVVFRALIHPGNSGGALVDLKGRVVGTIYAATVDQAFEGGYAVPNHIVEQAVSASSTKAVETGPCSAQ